MRRLAKERPDILIGAGTVLDAETARLCILEGAEFVVSPALNLKTIEMCHRYGVPVLPGALTPTEILTAWEAGADAVKVFPASALGGAKYLKSVKAPLPQVELVPTGGVSLATAAEFLEAGAFALGVGADLVNPKAIARGPPRDDHRKRTEVPSHCAKVPRIAGAERRLRLFLLQRYGYGAHRLLMV